MCGLNRFLEWVLIALTVVKANPMIAISEGSANPAYRVRPEKKLKKTVQQPCSRIGVRRF
jgi:hypothetical protein